MKKQLPKQSSTSAPSETLSGKLLAAGFFILISYLILSLFGGIFMEEVGSGSKLIFFLLSLGAGYLSFTMKIQAKLDFWWQLGLILIVGLIFYSNSLDNGYSLDDDLVTTVDNPTSPDKLRHHPTVELGIKGIPKIFQTHYAVNSKQSYDYRPVTTSSFAIEYDLNGEKPAEERAKFSHLVSLMLYILSGMLIFLLIQRLIPEKDWRISLLGALLFMIHPIHSEVVNNIKCRDELLVVFFGLIAMHLVLTFVDSGFKKWWWGIVACVLVALAALSKKNGLTFIVLIPLTIYFFRDVKLKHLGMFVGALMVAFLTFYLAKHNVSDVKTRELLYFENPLIAGGGPLSRLPMFFYTIFFYVKMMILPYPLVYFYGFDQIPIAGWGNIGTWIGMIIVLGGTGLALIRIKKKEPWAFGFLFFMLAIGGAANLLFPVAGIVGDRFLYLPSIGLLFVVAYYVVKLYDKLQVKSMQRYGLLSVGGFLVVITLMQVRSRNDDWTSRYSIYHNDIVHLENSAKAHSLLGTEYKTIADSIKISPFPNPDLRMAYIDSAITEYNKAVSIYPDYHNCENNVGVLYFMDKMDHQTAIVHLKNAVKSKPDYVEALFNIGSCYERDVLGYLHLTTAYRSIIPDSMETIVELKSPQNVDPLLLKAAVFKGIMLDHQKRILQANATGFNQQQVRNNYLQQAKIDMLYQINLEGGLMKADLNVEGLIAKLTILCNGFTPEIGANFGDRVIGLIEQDFNNVLVGNIAEFDIGNLNNGLNFVQQMVVVSEDSMIHYTKSALEHNPSYLDGYQRLCNFYIKKRSYDDLIEISEMAIEKGDFEPSTDFRLNIANAYNAKAKGHRLNGEMDQAKAQIQLAVEQLSAGQQELSELISKTQLDLEMDPNVKASNINQWSGSITKLKEIGANMLRGVGMEQEADQYLK